MSNYEGFSLNYTNEQGVIAHLADVDVIIYDADADEDIGTVSTDSNGYVAAGTLSVAVGTRVRFRVENYYGLAGSVSQITT